MWIKNIYHDKSFGEVLEFDLIDDETGELLDLPDKVCHMEFIKDLCTPKQWNYLVNER